MAPLGSSRLKKLLHGVVMKRLASILGPERRYWVWVLGIVGLGLLLRLGFPTLAEFKRDEATVIRRASAIAYAGDWPALGVGASVGVANPPFFLYLAALPLRLWPDPVAVVLEVGFLNGLAVLACYRVGRAYFGPKVGLIAAFLFAVCPWAVLYGRKIWSQNLPLVTLGFMAALLAAFVRGRRWALVGAFVGLAVLIGLHLGGLAFVPILGLCLLLYPQQVGWKPLLIGGTLLGLAFAPYVLYDALHGWSNARGFLHYGSGGGRWSWDALRYAFMLTGSAGIEGMAGALWPQFRAGLPDLGWLNGGLQGLLALALCYAVYQAVRGPQERRRSLLLLLFWFAVPIFLQSRPATPTQPHYFILLYPVQFLLIAVLVADGWEWLRRRLTLPAVGWSVVMAVLVGGALSWAGWQLAVMGQLARFMVDHPSTGGYGIPLRYTRAAAQEAQQLAAGAEIIVLSESTDPLTEETPAVFDALLYRAPHRLADGRTALPVPESTHAVYLVGPVRESSPLEPVLQRLASLRYVQSGPVLNLPDGGARYLLFHRSGPDREDTLAGLTSLGSGVALANQVVLAAYDLPTQSRSGETLPVWLAWWVRIAPPPGADYHFYAHFLNAQGDKVGQWDGQGFPTATWRTGDLALSCFPILLPDDLPPGPYTVRVGMYTYPEIVGIPVVDAAGKPVEAAVTLGAVSLAP